MNFDDAMAAFEPTLPFAVACSGGADSTALLVACAARWPGQVEGFHVHHGLQPAAEGFEQHCAAVCESVGVPLRVRRVDARHAVGESPEDAARRARYAAFEVLAGDRAHRVISTIALAQHADDQVETVLLALSRGAGLAGLAAMPAVMARGGLRYHRPLLGVRGADLRMWLVERGVRWVEDPSNVDTRYTRNRIRSEVLPVLDAAFPQFRTTFARSARHAAQAQALLIELAEQDVAAVGSPPVIQALQALSRARQANLLRYWLLQVHRCTPSTAQLDELLDQIAACTTRGHGVHLKLGAGFAERRGAVLGWYNSAPPTKPSR